MLHLILTHHVTYPSPPIAPQARDDKKKSIAVCQCDFALGFGITNWPEAHTHTHTPSQRQAPRLLPELSSQADSWHTLQRPPWAFRKPLPCSHLDSIDPPGPEPSASGTFPSFPGAHLQVSLPRLQSLNKEPFVTTFAPGLLTQRLAFAWPFATPVAKACPNH